MQEELKLPPLRVPISFSTLVTAQYFIAVFQYVHCCGRRETYAFLLDSSNLLHPFIEFIRLRLFFLLIIIDVQMCLGQAIRVYMEIAVILLIALVLTSSAISVLYLECRYVAITLPTDSLPSWVTILTLFLSSPFRLYSLICTVLQFTPSLTLVSRSLLCRFRENDRPHPLVF